MFYTREELNNLTYKEYVLLIAKELNSNGFSDKEGNEFNVGSDIHGNFVSDFSLGFIMSLKDAAAVDFLKHIGLLNNGRCPLTGLMINEHNKTTYMSEENVKFDINSYWIEHTKPTQNWGCILFPILLLIAVIWGFVNSFSFTTIVGICVGVLGILCSLFYSMSKIGNKWNKTTLSNRLNMNSATLHLIIKLDNGRLCLSPSMLDKFGIPNADYESYRRFCSGN